MQESGGFVSQLAPSLLDEASQIEDPEWSSRKSDSKSFLAKQAHLALSL